MVFIINLKIPRHTAVDNLDDTLLLRYGVSKFYFEFIGIYLFFKLKTFYRLTFHLLFKYFTPIKKHLLIINITAAGTTNTVLKASFKGLIDTRKSMLEIYIFFLLTIF